MREMAIERRDPATIDRRDVPVGGRRESDRLPPTDHDVLELAQREAFVPLDVLAKALKSSRKVLLRDWETRRFPVTTVGRRVLLPSEYVIRAYFAHTIGAVAGHSRPIGPDAPTQP